MIEIWVIAISRLAIFLIPLFIVAYYSLTTDLDTTGG